MRTVLGPLIGAAISALPCTVLAQPSVNMHTDTSIDLRDFGMFQSAFGQVGSPGAIPGDFDLSGSVDLADAAILAGSLTGPLPCTQMTLAEFEAEADAECRDTIEHARELGYTDFEVAVSCIAAPQNTFVVTLRNPNLTAPDERVTVLCSIDDGVSVLVKMYPSGEAVIFNRGGGARILLDGTLEPVGPDGSPVAVAGPTALATRGEGATPCHEFWTRYVPCLASQTEDYVVCGAALAGSTRGCALLLAGGLPGVLAFGGCVAVFAEPVCTQAFFFPLDPPIDCGPLNPNGYECERNSDCSSRDECRFGFCWPTTLEPNGTSCVPELESRRGISIPLCVGERTAVVDATCSGGFCLARGEYCAPCARCSPVEGRCMGDDALCRNQDDADEDCVRESCDALTGCVETDEPVGAPCCGNGLLDPGEECDDGNLINGDGCDANCHYEPIPVDEISTRSGWTDQVLATRRTWRIDGQSYVEVVRYGVTKRICPATGVFLDCPITWNVWKFVPLPGYFILPGTVFPPRALITVHTDNVRTEGCDDLDPLRRFSPAPADCPATNITDSTFIISTSPNYFFPLCYSTHSCGLYDPASPFLAQAGYTPELQTGCISEECPPIYDCPLPCLKGNPNWPACLIEGHCP